jgi:hypothetical protein
MRLLSCSPSTAFGGPPPPMGEASKLGKRTSLNVDWPYRGVS